MSAKYVYLLWDNEEHGPEQIMATTRRDRVLDMFDAYCESVECDLDEYRDVLIRLLAKDDSALCGVGSYRIPFRYPLGTGWGGLHFQVLRLEFEENKGDMP